MSENKYKETKFYYVNREVYELYVNYISGYWELSKVNLEKSKPDKIVHVRSSKDSFVALWGRIPEDIDIVDSVKLNNYYTYLKDYIKGVLCFKFNTLVVIEFDDYEDVLEHLNDCEVMETECKLSEVILEDDVRRSILQCINFVKKADRYEAMGVKVPRGIMLYGEPGTGKSLIAKTIASECNVKFIHKCGSEFIEKYAGVGPKRVRDMFEEARKQKSIIFIDEIDALGSRREDEGGGKEGNATLNQLLVELDGFKENKDIFVIGATNRLDIIDPALLRPGRFTRHLEITLPDLERRKQMFELYIGKMIHEEDIDILALAEATEGCSGADIDNIVNEAGMYAVDLDREEDILKEEDLFYIIERDKIKKTSTSKKQTIGFITQTV